VILKKESFRIPVVGQGMRLVGFVPVDRKGIRGGKRSIDRAVRMIREKGHSFLIFPEGTGAGTGTSAFQAGRILSGSEQSGSCGTGEYPGDLRAHAQGRFFHQEGKGQGSLSSGCPGPGI